MDNKTRALLAIRAAIQAKEDYEMDENENEAGATFSRDTYPLVDFIDSMAEYGLQDAGPSEPTMALEIVKMLRLDGYLSVED